MGLIRSRTRERDEGQASADAAATTHTAAGASDSLIAAGMVLTGDCRTDGMLRIHGHVRGSVHARRLAIGPTGRVDGDVTGAGGGGGEHAVLIDGRVGGEVRAPQVEVGRGGEVGAGIQARQAVVRGRVTGGIRAEERLVMAETAVVEGDVIARLLGLQEGGQVSGTIRIGDAGPGERDREPEAAEASEPEAKAAAGDPDAAGAEGTKRTRGYEDGPQPGRGA